MIDIHTHVLPQIDDGPSQWSDALALIRQGVADGIKGIVCTSHVVNRLDQQFEEKLISQFNQLKEMVQKEAIGIDLYLGSEIHCNAQFDYHSRVATINGDGKFILMELPLGNIPADAGNTFFQLSLDGLTPILAHPERNSVIMRKPQYAYEYVLRGVLMQMNAGSITGVFGKQVKKTATEMLNHRLVHFVASDSHDADSRPMILSKAYELIAKQWGNETANRLFFKNPLKMVQGISIPAAEPIPFGTMKKKRGLFRSKFL